MPRYNVNVSGSKLTSVNYVLEIEAATEKEAEDAAIKQANDSYIYDYVEEVGKGSIEWDEAEVIEVL